MQQQIIQWLQAMGLTHYTNALSVVAVLVVIAFISLLIHLFLHKCLLGLFKRRAENSPYQWSKALLRHKLFNRAAWLIQGILFQILTQALLDNNTPIFFALMTAVQLWMILFSLLIGFSLLDVIQYLTARSALARQLPLRVSCKVSSWWRLF